jgi:hypothetical protein
VIAGLSFTFALASALGVFLPVALLAGVAWGAAIMSLDRWLVTSLPTTGGKRFQLAIPRVLLAVLLGAVISTPMVLQIFKPEIDAQIVQIQLDRGNDFERQRQSGENLKSVNAQQATVDALGAVIRSSGKETLDPAKDPTVRDLNTARDVESKKKDTLYADWQCQLLGIPSTALPKCKKGDGKLAKAAERGYNASVQRVKDLEKKIDDRKGELNSSDKRAEASRLEQAQDQLPAEQTRLDDMRDEQDRLRKAFNKENEGSEGLLLRIQALDEVTAKNSSLATARLVLFLLFLLIECLPVLVKLMQKPGFYEELVGVFEAQERDRVLDLIHSTPMGGGPRVSVQDIWAGDETRRMVDAEPPTEYAGQPQAPGGPAPVASGGLEDALLRGMDDDREIRTFPQYGTRPDVELHLDDDR